MREKGNRGNGRFPTKSQRVWIVLDFCQQARCAVDVTYIPKTFSQKETTRR